MATAAWTRKEGKNPSGGLNKKGVASYRAANPGSKLKMAVTTKPSKLKPGSKSANRRKSFCARMSGNKGPMKKPNGKPTPKALALRRWNCESIEQMAQMIEQGEQMISEMKQRLDPKCWTGKHKEGTKNIQNPVEFSQQPTARQYHDGTQHNGAHNADHEDPLLEV